LTIAVADQIAKQRVKCSDDGHPTSSPALETAKEVPSHYLETRGCDIDPEVIDRATKKTHGDKVNQSFSFSVCNLCYAQSYEQTMDDFWKPKSSPGHTSRFDFTTIFSTTMWIHTYGGDEGLKHFLERSCDSSEMILIEPQPSRWKYWPIAAFSHVSGELQLIPRNRHLFPPLLIFSSPANSYRKVNERLRKQLRPDVNLSGLTMRSNIENEIEQIVLDRGFRRVHISADGDLTDDNYETTSTSWQRSIRLHERVASA
jgi:hypothetical protein